MRIVFAGSGEVAIPTLEAMRESRHDIVAVITQPPRPAGRKRRPVPTPVELIARTAGLNVSPCENINAPEQIRALSESGAELIVVIDFGQNIGAAVRESVPRGAINLHGSLLPALRGAGPIQWACIQGLTRTGATTFQVVDRMDAGDIYLQEAIDVGPDETADELRVRMASLGARLVLRTIEGLADGTLHAQPQDESLVTRAPKLKKSDGILDFTQGSATIVNRIRGCWSWPGATAEFHHGDRPPVRVIFARARATESTAEFADDVEPGDVCSPLGQTRLCVRTGDGAIEITQLKVAGKRLMDWRDFINGYRVAAGDRFAPPESR